MTKTEIIILWTIGVGLTILLILSIMLISLNSECEPFPYKMENMDEIPENWGSYVCNPVGEHYNCCINNVSYGEDGLYYNNPICKGINGTIRYMC